MARVRDMNSTFGRFYWDLDLNLGGLHRSLGSREGLGEVLVLRERLEEGERRRVRICFVWQSSDFGHVVSQVFTLREARQLFHGGQVV